MSSVVGEAAAKAVDYEPVIGLEVHTQLKTKSKIFCGCSTAFGAGPNDQVCPVCLGMPGVLPVLNRLAVDFAIKVGLALNCQIAKTTKFDRKNYFYADLPKGYQISQYDQPICKSGYLTIGGKKIRIHRAHLEEDAGKLVHAGATGLHGSDYSLVDFNRSSVPLLEIVSEPDITSPEEARQYLTELRNILRYIDVSDGNLEEGSFRCDANVSIRPVGTTSLGTRTEIKNMNSFRAVQRAIQSEIERQTELVKSGEKVIQQTRLWDDNTQTTHPMRSKEEAHDYRYFPEPDLVPLSIDQSWIDRIAAQLPELPEARRTRYVAAHNLPIDDAVVLAETKELGDFFDLAVAQGASPRLTANWLIGPIIAHLKESKQEIAELKLTAKNLADLSKAVSDNVISSTGAKQLLLDLAANSGDVVALISERGLAQISDEGDLKRSVSEIIAKFPEQLADYRAGKNKIRQFFFGEVMKATKGKANPGVINKLLDELLSS
jgi:aspartyl-tRNA(Asn)/glutamyl-tRNA(Gln) amidotransferase subunit B